MAGPEKFRIAAIVVGAVLLTYSCASALSGITSAPRPQFPNDPTKINAPRSAAWPDWTQSAAPYRTDVAVAQSLSTALRALRASDNRPSTQILEENLRAQIDVKQTLSFAAHSSVLWLALALLQTQRNPRDKQVIDSLKMSYFTAPSDADLMSLRINAVTIFDASADSDLGELARGDLRLMLTRRPELRPAVTAAYRRASQAGKTFLEKSVQSLDPDLTSVLRGK